MSKDSPLHKGGTETMLSCLKQKLPKLNWIALKKPNNFLANISDQNKEQANEIRQYFIDNDLDASIDEKSNTIRVNLDYNKLLEMPIFKSKLETPPLPFKRGHKMVSLNKQ